MDPRLGLLPAIASDLLPCVSDQSLSASQVTHGVLLKEAVDEAMQLLGQEAGLRQQVLRGGLQVGLGLRREMIQADDPGSPPRAIALMKGYPLQSEKDFDLPRSDLYSDLFAAMQMRHRVEGALHGDRRVRMDSGDLPIDFLKGNLRQRLEQTTLFGLPAKSARGLQAAVHAVIDLLNDRRQGLVDLGNRREAPMTIPEFEQAHDQPHRVLHQSLVLGRGDSGRNDGGAVVGGQLCVAGVEVRIVEMGLAGPGLQIVWNRDVRHAAEEGVHPLVGSEPARLLFVLEGAREDELAEAQYPDEDVSFLWPARGVLPEDLIAGPIDLAVGAGVELPQGDGLLEQGGVTPGQVFPEIGVACGVRGPLFPDPLDLEALADLLQNTGPGDLGGPGRIQRLGSERERAEGFLSKPSNLSHAAPAQMQRPGYRTVRQPLFDQSQDFLNPLHGKNPPGHLVPPWF